jgi:hypothetical protein
MDEEIQFTVDVLKNAVRDSNIRLQTALRLREQVHAALEAGDHGHYRVDWIKDGVKRVLDTLELLAREFNASHPNDLCTTRDFGDVLMSTIATLRDY